MTLSYAIHADAASELMFEDIGQAGMHLLTSQCQFNEMRCEDHREKMALTAFNQQAEINLNNSGILSPFAHSNIDHFFHHFCVSRLHIILLANDALMHDHNHAIESDILTVRSDRNHSLRNKGIKPASIKVLMHNSGTAFAGLAVLQVAIAAYLAKMKGQKVSKQEVKNTFDHLCQNSLNLSVIDLSEVSKHGRQLLNLSRLQKNGCVIVRFQNNKIDVLESFEQRIDAVNHCMNSINQSQFHIGSLYINQHKNIDNNPLWQNFSVALHRKNVEIKHSLPSLAAMLTFGKSIINFGWIELKN